MSAVGRRLKFLYGKCRGQENLLVRHPPTLDYSAHCWTAFLFNPVLGYFAFWAQRKGLQALRADRRKEADNFYLLSFVCIATSIVVTGCIAVLFLTELLLASKEAAVAKEMSKHPDIPKSKRNCQNQFSKEKLETVNGNDEKNCDSLREVYKQKFLNKTLDATTVNENKNVTRMDKR